MSSSSPKIPETYAKMSQQQLQIYASELRDHFLEERRLREQLEVRNRELGQRITELAALNRLFRRFLDDYFAMMDAYGHVETEVFHLAHQATELADRIRAQKPKDVQIPPEMLVDADEKQ